MMSLYESTTVDLTITVLDTATIFEGPEAIYRYDLPGTAVVEGWALSGVMDQAQKMLPAQWPEVTVAVVADYSGGPMSHEAVKIIRRQLQVHNVVIAEHEPAVAPARYEEPAELPRHYDTAVEPEPEGADIIRPSDEDESFLTQITQRKGLIALLALLVVIIAVIIWALFRSRSQPAEEITPASSTSIAATPTAHAASTPSTSASSDAAPVHHTIEAGGLRVVLPEGFTHTEEDGLVTATGQDPNLRIIMVMDPLYAVPVNALFAEIRAQIDTDETLSDPHESNGRLTYIERPGDDSEVKWTTWVDDGQQVSLGCHTRTDPSMAQRAACRMAAESIEKAA